MKFICPACERIFSIEQNTVDEFYPCECGRELYVFYNQEMNICMPAEEAKSRIVAQLMRRFVTSTGRCPEVKTAPVTDYREILKTVDPMALMEVGLVRYQMETIGNQPMHCTDVENILEIINEDGKDAIVKKRSDTSVIVKEQRTREPKRPKIDYIRLMEEQLGEPELKQWQIDIMEQDAARTGKLFGDCG